MKAGIQAVRSAAPQARVMIHLSDWGKAQWWLDSAYRLDIEPFDILGVSFYEQFHSITSGGPLNTLRCACNYCLTAVSNQYPELDVIVVETAFPHEPTGGNGDLENNFTQANADFPFTPDGQSAYLRTALRVVTETFGPSERRPHAATGVYWWCTECIDAYWQGFSDAYVHQALFDEAGVALPAQQAWAGEVPTAAACEAALTDSCGWTAAGESPQNCEACVAAVGRTSAACGGSIQRSLLGAWCLGVFQGAFLPCVH